MSEAEIEFIIGQAVTVILAILATIRAYANRKAKDRAHERVRELVRQGYGTRAGDKDGKHTRTDDAES